MVSELLEQSFDVSAGSRVKPRGAAEEPRGAVGNGTCISYLSLSGFSPTEVRRKAAEDEMTSEYDGGSKTFGRNILGRHMGVRCVLETHFLELPRPAEL